MVEKEYIEKCVLKPLFVERFHSAFMQEKARENSEYWRGVCAGVNWGLNTILDAPTADVLEANGDAIRKLYYAVYALADMVNQFGYDTTFRRKESLCDGGLSALENAFYALRCCGCPMNSNGTVTREKLFEFMDEMEDRGTNNG